MLLDPSLFTGLTYNIIENVLRVRMPARFRTMPQDQIEPEMRHAENIAYVLLNKVDRILATLCDTAKELVDQRLTQIHELAGTVFQRLIVDRKYVKANYTRPTSQSPRKSTDDT